MKKTIVLNQQEGFKFTAAYGNNEVIADLKEEAGGMDQGMTPGELLCASLGACTAMNIVQYCETIDMPIEGLKVYATYSSDEEDSRAEKFVLKIVMPKEISGREKALIRVADGCYVKNTLQNSPAIEVQVETQ
jgi:putative redox protein